MAKNIKIVEVGPRDGLQNEKLAFTLAQKYQLIKRLSNTGLKTIEAGAFVSPNWVPQMADSKKLIQKIINKQKQKTISASINFTALVPNERGMELAVSTGIKEVAIFAAASESFSKKNINCSIEESLKRFLPVIKMARKNKIKIRGYLSTVFGCPYEGDISFTKVLTLTQKLLDLGVYEVSLGDTTGVANPKQVGKVLEKLVAKVNKNKIAMHFHDTRGMALANIVASLKFGISCFDSSVGGLGGCPYARGASGNVATEDVVYMLEKMDYKTGIDVGKLVKITHFLEALMERPMGSKLSKF